MTEKENDPIAIVTNAVSSDTIYGNIVNVPASF